MDTELGPGVREHSTNEELVELFDPVFELEEELAMVVFGLVFLIRHECFSNIFVSVPIFTVVTPISRPISLHSPVVSNFEQSDHTVALRELVKSYNQLMILDLPPKYPSFHGSDSPIYPYHQYPLHLNSTIVNYLNSTNSHLTLFSTRLIQPKI